MSTEEVHQEADRQILRDLVANAPPYQDNNSPVQDILKCYDYDTDSSEIFTALNKFYKTDLLVAAGYLNNLPKTFKKKVDLVNAIIKRIDNLLTEECPKCKEWYSVSKDEEPTVSCYLCGQGCHEACYDELGPLLERFPGLKYMCVRCEGSTDQPPKKEDNQSATKTQTPPPAAPNSPHRKESESDSDNDEEEDQPVCQLLRRRECPYGVSGKTPVNGLICKFKHPKRCQPYCKYSTDPQEGCTKGKDCNLLHPILCKFAIRSKLCTNRQCKFTHPVGTKRYRPKRQDDERKQENHKKQSKDESQNTVRKQESSNEKDSNNMSGKSNSANQEPDKNYFNSNQIESSFLVQITNQIKEMQKEMQEMKEIYKRPPAFPQLPWFQLPLLNNQIPSQNIHPTGISSLVSNLQNSQSMSPKVPQLTTQMLQHPQTHF